MPNSRKAVLALLLYVAGVLTPFAYEGGQRLLGKFREKRDYEALMMIGLAKDGTFLGAEVGRFIERTECRKAAAQTTASSDSLVAGIQMHGRPLGYLRGYCANLGDRNLKIMRDEAIEALRDVNRYDVPLNPRTGL